MTSSHLRSVRPNSALTLALCLILASSLSACGDDDPAPAQQPDPFASCVSQTLEPDQTFFGAPAGPAVNPDTGMITPPAGAVIATTYLALKPGEETFDRFLEIVGPVQQELQRSPGLLAITTSDSRTCSVARTLTVWESEEAMMAFVMSDAHLAAMQATGTLSRGTSVTTTWTHDGQSDVSWERAALKLKDHMGPVY